MTPAARGRVAETHMCIIHRRVGRLNDETLQHPMGEIDLHQVLGLNIGLWGCIPELV